MSQDMIAEMEKALTAQKRHRRWRRIVTTLAGIVVFCVTYALILPAITLEQEARQLDCPLSVHQHTEECYDGSGQLICGQADFVVHTHTADCYDADGQLQCQLPEIEAELHQHTAACYDEEDSLVCGKLEVQEHIHGEGCFVQMPEESAQEQPAEPETSEPVSDPEADVETAAMWEAGLADVELTEDLRENLLAVARSQLGYAESTANFELAENGRKKGYTRYGAWYGDACGDWCAMFVSFCLHYAQVPEEQFPLDANCETWIQTLEEEPWQLYHPADPENPEEEPYAPQPGDLIFFSWEEDGEADHVGIVAELIPAEEEEPARIRTIEGNAEDQVQYVTYEAEDPAILGYAEVPRYRMTTLSFAGEDYTVTVRFSSQAKLPEGTTLAVSEITPDSEEYQTYYEQSLEAVEEEGGAQTVVLARFFDIHFLADGETVEPAAPVEVSITYADAAQPEANTSCRAVHFTEDGTEVLETQTESQEDGSLRITHTQSGFSVVGDVMIMADTDDSSGTQVTHTVTFKVLIDNVWQEVGTQTGYSVNESGNAYINSADAEKVLSAFGYTAQMDPAYRFGSSYNDIYHIAYGANTGFRMDVNGAAYQDNTVIHLWTANATDAQVFRIWEVEPGYCYITPIQNSSFHVNVTGGGTSDGTKLILHSATDNASRWRVVSNADGTTSFYNKNAPNTACIDLPSGTLSNGNQLQIWTNGGNRYWKLEQLYRISNTAASVTEADGTYRIGLTAESNGDIVCYYLPAETTGAYTNQAEEALSASNAFWSVRVVDKTHSVYADDELSDMVQYVQNGGSAKVTVQNEDGILWSCVGKNGEPLQVTSSQSGGYTTFDLNHITQPVEVVATKANPSFTVQYYANITRYAESGSNPLTVIDTSGGVLPTNGGSMATKNLYLEGTGQYTSQNQGDATQLYRIQTTTELTKMYTEQEYQYQASPGLKYFNKLKDNESYALQEIWILKEGKDPASTNREDWTIYPYSENIAFTNEAGQASDQTLLIEEDAVIRLVSDTTNGNYYNGTTFYDYNISSGQNADGRWRTGITGINSESNYGTSRNGQRNWRSGADILAFGNANCGTGMSGYLFDGSTLNKYSNKNSSYGGATFGLVSGLNSDGTLLYNEWIVAPKLFNEGGAEGKQTYADSSLTFERVGDTYTLSAATLNNSDGQSNTLSGLQYFFNPSPTSGTTHTHIFTNNFWPMDPAAGRTDALWGTYGNPGSFQGFTEANNYNWSDLAKDFPVSDDGQAHNWFFGMNFAISFALEKDYEGPLEYYFFGDDDLWVFLDGELVCDIGGVHSSIGEYVNLRDYLPVGSSGQHTLSFFYTERGASGSTCYMSFTLPSVSSATTAQDTGSLKIEKTVEADSSIDYSKEEYEFQVELLTAQDGAPLNQTYSYSRSDDTYGNIKSGGTIALKANETVTISGIPAGTFYRVTEQSRDGYRVTANGTTGYIVSGTIETGAVKPASFVNTPIAFELPQTGGAGTRRYTFSGLAIIACAVLLCIYFRRKRSA